MATIRASKGELRRLIQSLLAYPQVVRLGFAALVGEGTMAPSLLLEVLLLSGVMGLLGQGARTVIGLKSMTDDAKALNVTPNDLFQAARLLTSLMIGFLVGVAAALI
jgi:hypothetical protein